MPLFGGRMVLELSLKHGKQTFALVRISVCLSEFVEQPALLVMAFAQRFEYVFHF
jgi:hypothetical protein